MSEQQNTCEEPTRSTEAMELEGHVIALENERESLERGYSLLYSLLKQEENRVSREIRNKNEVIYQCQQREEYNAYVKTQYNKLYLILETLTGKFDAVTLRAYAIADLANELAAIVAEAANGFKEIQKEERAKLNELPF